MKQSKVEILAPAGSYESLVAAVNAGADAVYVGGTRFGARAYAGNLDEEKMLEAIDYVHLHGCRIYMTVNTLMKERELTELGEYLLPYYQRGLDAVIVQDMGAFTKIRRCFPDLPIHASTQMTVTGVYGARLLAGLGAERVVTARELSLEEIREIHDTLDIEIESFVHGALCYSYSGQCLFSSLIGGRSGNRGRCAQPCRLPYEVKDGSKSLNQKNQNYVLSLKDLCTLDILPDLIESGVFSLKIEGRMKSPRYTAGVVSTYRNYVDLYLDKGRNGYFVDPKDRRMLLDLFDRGGQTEGYYSQHNGRDMVVLKEKPSFREGNEELFSRIDEAYVEKKKQEPVCGCLNLESGKPSQLVLHCGEISVTVTGELASDALNQPVAREKVEKQIMKTGGSPYFFKQLEIQIKGNLFLPVQALNELRRRGLEALTQEVLSSYRRISDEKGISGERRQDIVVWEGKTESVTSPFLVASMEDQSLLSVLLEERNISEIYLDCTIAPGHWSDDCFKVHQAGKRCYLMLPYIFRTEAKAYYTKRMQLLKRAGFDGIVIRTLEELEFLREQDIHLPLIFDHTLYQWNYEARKLYEDMGASRLTMPLELNSRELAGCSTGEELVVYGYLPMMVSAQCMRKTVEGCKKQPGILKMKDRLGKKFPVKNYCDFCYNVIYNSIPLSLCGQENEARNLNPCSFRLQFTMETEAEARAVIQDCKDCFLRGESVSPDLKEFTKGHWKRGVE